MSSPPTNGSMYLNDVLVFSNDDSTSTRERVDLVLTVLGAAGLFKNILVAQTLQKIVYDRREAEAGEFCLRRRLHITVF